MYIYIYMYIHRERCMYVYIHTYMNRSSNVIILRYVILQARLRLLCSLKVARSEQLPEWCSKCVFPTCNCSVRCRGAHTGKQNIFLRMLF